MPFQIKTAKGAKRMRWRWPLPGDPRVAKMRRRVQDGGRGLYMLRPPPRLEPAGGGDTYCLVEGYYPDELGSAYWRQVDPWRREEWRMGRMVVLNTGWYKAPTVFNARDTDFDLLLDEVRRNNRNARRDLRRQVHEPYARQAMANRQQEEEDEVLDETADRIAKRGTDALLHGGNPRIAVPSHVH
jgi:hypothetical protein